MKRLFNLPKFRKPVFIPALLITGLVLLNLVTPFKAAAGVIGVWRIADTIPFKSEKVSQTDSIVLNGNIKKVFPLFGAFDERKWAEGWNPTLVYMSADTIEVGTTFKTGSHGFGEPGYTWRINQYEPQKRLIQYLVMSPNRYWTITVKCRSVAPNKTLAAINYTFIGLNAMGNHLDEHFIEKIYKNHLKDWEQAINAFLEKDK